MSGKRYSSISSFAFFFCLQALSLVKCTKDTFLVHVPEIRILLIRQILKSMCIALIFRVWDPRRGDLIPLCVSSRQCQAENDECQDQKTVAANMDGESDKVARRVPREEDLRALKQQISVKFNVSSFIVVDKSKRLTNGVSHGPSDKVHGHGNRFLGLTGYIPRE